MREGGVVSERNRDRGRKRKTERREKQRGGREKEE